MNNMVRKANSIEIINHWVLVTSFFVLTISGFAFVFHLEQVISAFGGTNSMKVIHNWAGVVFSGSLFITIIYYLPVALHFTGDDMEWIFKAGGYLSKKVQVPPQDELNAGQKLFYLLFLASGVAIAVTGFVIWLRPWGKEGILLSFLLHNISFVFMMIAIPAHIYLATLANPGTFRIMVYGTVPYDWAKKRHAKWLAKQKAHA